MKSTVGLLLFASVLFFLCTGAGCQKQSTATGTKNASSSEAQANDKTAQKKAGTTTNDAPVTSEEFHEQAIKQNEQEAAAKLMEQLKEEKVLTAEEKAGVELLCACLTKNNLLPLPTEDSEGARAKAELFKQCVADSPNGALRLLAKAGMNCN